MSGNRFDFLEFEGEEARSEGADGTSAPPNHPAEPDDSGYGQALIPFGMRAADGLAMSEVSKPERDPDREIANTFMLAMLPDDDAAAEKLVPKPVARLHVVEVFGELGGKAGQFNFPCGLSLDREGILFVADSYNHRVQRITPDNGVSAIGGRGAGRGEFMLPQDTATDSDSAFYVVEQGNHRVQKFSSEGVIEMVFGRPGSKWGEFKGPMAIAVASSGDIFVADTGNSRVQRFDAEGRFLSLIGERTETFAGLSSPQGLAIDIHDNLYIADTITNIIARFDPTGRFAGHYGDKSNSGQPGKNGINTFNQPRAIAVDTAGLLYMADLLTGTSFDSVAAGRCRVLDTATGKTRTILDQIGHGMGAFGRPSGVAVAFDIQTNMKDRKPASALYAADTANHRILRFAWK